MSSQMAKPSVMGDLALNIPAYDPHDHRRHGLLSPSTSVSRSHEDGEGIAAADEKPAIQHLLSRDLEENTTDLLTSHSPSSGDAQPIAPKIPEHHLGETAHLPPVVDVQVTASEAPEQSKDIAELSTSTVPPRPCTPPRENTPQREPSTPRKSFSQLIVRPSTKKARKMVPRKKKSTPPIPLEIHILALTDRNVHPYASVAPKHAFTLNLVPDTTLAEVCTHAGDFLDLHFNKFVDSSRLEARDGNGYVFEGTEAIGQELGAGGKVYLIEEAVDVGEAKKKLLRNLDAPKGKDARTPKAKMVKEPRKTPSQRNLEIAQQGGRIARTNPRKTPLQTSQAERVVRSEPKRRTTSLAPLELKDRPLPPTPMRISSKPQEEQDASEPVIESIEDSSPAIALEKRRHSSGQLTQDADASEPSVRSFAGSPPAVNSAKRRNSTTRPSKREDAPEVLMQSIENAPPTTEQATSRNHTSQPAAAEDVDASVPAVALQHKLPPPTSTASLPSQDERVIPDSQDQPSQSIGASPPKDTMATSWKPINAPRPSAEIQPRSAGRAKTSKAQSLVDAQDRVNQKQPDLLLSKPDPYDISAVLSDNEYYSPRQSNTILSSSIRKLGSATKCSTPAPASVRRNSLLITKQSLEARSKSSVRSKPIASSQDEASAPSTPLARVPANTPARAEPSSAPGPLLSSPTNHVAAALARGRAKARRQPYPECVVIEESDDEVDDDVLFDATDRFSNPRHQSQSLEASLPWSAPPLRMRGEDPFWTLRTTGRRSLMGCGSDVDDEADSMVRGKEPSDARRQVAVPVLKDNAREAQVLHTSGIPSSSLGSPVKDPTKRVLQSSARKSPVRSPVKPPLQVVAGKSPVLIVHGSSSSEEGVEEIGYVDKTLPSTQPASPAKTIKTVAARGFSSQDKDEDKSGEPISTTGAPQVDKLFREEQPIEPRQALSEDGYALDFPDDDNDACLPVINELPPLIFSPLEKQTRPQDKLCQITRVLETDPNSDNVIDTTPPSGQPFKRKRELSGDLDSEEERRMRKKAKYEARTARKAEKKRLREEKKAKEEELQRQQQVLLQEERKRLAMEKAYRRALELEIVVSSPTKAAEMGLLSDAGDSDQESELGSSPPVRASVPPVLEGSDDSLESKESEERPSWRKLSKRHFSTSPSPSQEGGATEVLTESPSSGAMDVTVVEGPGARLAGSEAEVLQEHRPIKEAVKQSRCKTNDDWILLEAALGAFAYSPLQIHNRIHMQMVQANLQGMGSRARQEDEATTPPEHVRIDATEKELDSQPVRVVKRKDTIARSSSVDPQPPQESAEDEDEDEDEVSRHTIRSPAPSPKNLTTASAQILKEDRGNKRRTSHQNRSQRRKSKENERKKRWRMKERPGLSKGFKRKHTFWKKGGKQ